MSLAKIALFVFGLAAVLVAGSVNADAARVSRTGWSNSYYPGGMVPADEEARFDRAKGVIQ
jgi:hypothetical protein